MHILSRMLVLLVALHTVACAGLGPPSQHPRSPEAWRGYWDAQHREEMASTPIEPAHAVGHGQTVLLVPGMTIGHEMFETMAQRLRRDGFSPVLYEDAALLTDGVVPSAHRLAARVDELVAARGGERIDIVAECVGGLVTSYYVRLLGGGTRVGHVVTFVSPHHGSWPAAIAAAVTGWQGLRDIRRDSALVRVVDENPIPTGVEFTSIYSCHDNLLLPHDTAAVAGARNIELCRYPLDHFAGFWDSAVYGLIADALADRDAEVANEVARLNARQRSL